MSLSSQRIRPGDLYAALPGARAHGIDFADAAVAAGAVAVLTDPAGRRPARPGVPLLVVDQPRARCSARLAARVYGEPAAVAAADRRHRHPGQDHHHPARRGRARSRPACRRR